MAYTVTFTADTLCEGSIRTVGSTLSVSDETARMLVDLGVATAAGLSPQTGSSAAQFADTFMAKANNLSDVAVLGTAQSNIGLSDKAPINDAALTGVPTAPTAAAGTSTTQIATTAFVQQEVPQASSSVYGKVMLSTYIEAIKGSDNSKAVTSLGLNKRICSMDFWDLIAVGFAGNTSGTGAVIQGGAYYKYVTAPTTAIGHAIAYYVNYYFSGANSGGGGYNSPFNFSRYHFLKARIRRTSASTEATTVFRLLVGRPNGAVTTPRDLDAKGYGFVHYGDNTAFLQVHNGTTLTNIQASITLPYTNIYDIEIISDGLGNVTLYIDNTPVATTSLGPTGLGASLSNTVLYEAQNTAILTGLPMAVTISNFKFNIAQQES